VDVVVEVGLDIVGVSAYSGRSRGVSQNFGKFEKKKVHF
jgi:hypothetical protein